ncbi:MAG: DUF262 domain-containing protein [Bacteroidetes bacterium]|nr:DUF262 domain-containing protein [Bacteroidota bacterium]
MAYLIDISERIFEGIEIPGAEGNLFHNKKSADKNSLLYLQQGDFEYPANGTDKISVTDDSKFVKTISLQKKFRFQNIQTQKLSYDDYLFDTSNKKLYFHNKDFEFEILPSKEIIVIRPYGYLMSFLRNQAGKKYLEQHLTEIYTKECADKIELVRKIYIPGDLYDIEDRIKEGIRPDEKLIDHNSIRFSQGVITLDKIIKRITLGEINLDTSTYFQRKSGLWEEDVKSRFIEALLVRQPIPAFFFDATNEDKWLIVDGLQRLSTVKEFVLDKSLKLSDLYYLSRNEYNNKGFDGLPRSLQRNIEEYEIVAYSIQKGTPEEVKYKIFKSINTSALRLENQEIRYALNQGRAVEWLNQFAEVPFFKNKVNPFSGKQNDRMAGHELALRHLAFRMIPYQYYTPPASEFLDSAMTKIKEIKDEDLEKFKSDFSNALFTIDKIFGDHAYRRIMFGGESEKFSNILFEIWTYVVSILTENQRNKLIAKKHIILIETKKIMEADKEFERSIDPNFADTIEAVQKRFGTLERVIKNSLK